MYIVYRIVGLALITLVLFDVFKSVIVPRITSRLFRIAPFLVGQLMWPSYKNLARSRLFSRLSTEMFETFGPAGFVILVLVWLLLMVSGYAFILYSFKDGMKPPIKDLAEAFYFAGASVLTIGYGDVVAATPITRAVVLTGALCGLVFMALVISYLFTIQNWLQQREQTVNTLRSRAGTPPSGLVLLLRYKELNLLSTLGPAFLHWESWAASILESHRAYPLLVYFRSSNKNESWLSAMGAMLDAACIVLTSIDEVAVGEADLFYWLSCTCIQAVSDYMGAKGADGVHLTRKEYEDGLSILADVGYKVRSDDKAWLQFSARRTGYMGNLIGLSEMFAIPVHSWIRGLPLLQVESESDVEKLKSGI